MEDISLAERYIIKANNAKSNNIIFQLSFMSYKNLMTSKKCKYSGIKLTGKRQGKKIRFTDRTIDRIDNRIGYVKGNCVAVCHGVNTIKSMIENPENPLTAKGLEGIAKFSKLK